MDDLLGLGDREFDRSLVARMGFGADEAVLLDRPTEAPCRSMGGFRLLQMTACAV
jgi:hypothetical protein